MKNSEAMLDWLEELGFSHCFFLAGGNIMHLLDAARSRFECVAVTHEVTAGIACEYFNQLNAPNQRAFALVTAGPGVTNIVTAIAGSWLESRELLVIAGQVKVADLRTGGVRQRGIQELNAVPIVAPIAKMSVQFLKMPSRDEFTGMVQATWEDRPGPVFLEVPLDLQGAPFSENDCSVGVAASEEHRQVAPAQPNHLDDAEAVGERIAKISRTAKQPIWLLGGGVRTASMRKVADQLEHLGIPVMTTWNGADRYDSGRSNYVGRPNTWGQRGPNALLDKADLIVAYGTRLGLQQTGFNWKSWAEQAYVAQIDIDRSELAKGHPLIDEGYSCDAGAALESAIEHSAMSSWASWLKNTKRFLAAYPTIQEENSAGSGFIEVYRFIAELHDLTTSRDVIIPSSSGGANSTMMQAFEVKRGQRLLTNKGLASMGYGLAGAVGAAIAQPNTRVILVEGDGGFSQNLQELATVAVRKLNLKIVLFCNDGYGSIRTTQSNYFDGEYLGCDVETGLGFPDWSVLSGAYGIRHHRLSSALQRDGVAQQLLSDAGPVLFEVPVDPDQTYWPKVTSRVTSTGGMESSPLHKMTPDLGEAPNVFGVDPE